MFDGSTLEAEIPDPESWLQRLRALPNAPAFFSSTDTESGEIKRRRYDTHTTIKKEAVIGHYDAELKESNYPDGSKKVFLTLRGSLHKNHHGGSNWQPFPVSELRAEIAWIESQLLLPAAAFKLNTLEVGVNLPVSFPVSDFLERQALLFGTGEMTPYRPANGLSLGRYCPGAEKSLKLYDKGKQKDLPTPLMRYEMKFHKMRELKKLGISHLPDLLDAAHYPALLEMLLTQWDKILIAYPFPETTLQTFTPKDAQLLEKGCFRDFWRMLHDTKGSDAFTNARKKYRQLLARQGITIGEEIKGLIRQQWAGLTAPLPTDKAATVAIDFYGKSPTVTPAQPGEPKEPENAFLRKIPIKINGDFPLGTLEGEKLGEAERILGDFHPLSPKKPPAPARCCRSCGKDISHQLERTLFCSPKFVGEQAAHRCRNAEHNRLRDMRNRAHRYENGTLFDITPYTPMPVNRLIDGCNGYQRR